MVETVKVINIEQKKECKKLASMGDIGESLRWQCGWRCRGGGVGDGSVSESGSEFGNKVGSQSECGEGVNLEMDLDVKAIVGWRWR